MKTQILCFICIMASMALHAQNTLHGQVINETNNESLSFVNIYFPELEQGSTTDEAGNFSISNLPNGNFKIIFSFIGFETLSMSITLPTEEDLNVGLSPSAIEIEEVILSTPFHKLQSENVMKVEREKVSDLISSGATNLSQGISNIAGVESISTGNSIGKPVIRGLSSNRVLVYTQGIRLENQQFGDEHGLGISDSGIESVEVIKGPASLLYGSDALGGVLYLNPERFAPENSRSADGSFDYYSNTRGYNTNLGFKSSSDAFKLIF
ncbi:MAG: carboxypeptidase-like regulatory domain-containing protein, partial [Bacteroidia bacterium]|nr:carboxypeptidase-like regulatory domain-containing protein [Bacteroidia bacterium]